MLIQIIFSVLLSYTSPSAETYNCTTLYDGIDVKTKLYRKELAPEYFFSYSPPELKNELKTHNLMNVDAQVSKIESNQYLNLNIHMYSAQATKMYGSIEAQSKMVITTIYGREIELLSRAKSVPLLTNDPEINIYVVSYDLDRSSIKRLSSEEIDKVGIEWTSGFEDYTIYEVDFLKNQLGCLNN
jgi:hypothetical protein